MRTVKQIGQHMLLFNQISANGGDFYVTDCQPWAIKTGCDRLDCPMRSLKVAPEAAPDSVLIQCSPAGDLADLLIKIRHTQFTPVA
jgi:hypothetical protein